MFLKTYGSPPSLNASNAEYIHECEAKIEKIRQILSENRPKETLARLSQNGRMTAEERVQSLCDAGTIPLYQGELQGFDTPPDGHTTPYRLGVICALGTIENRQAIIIANDNTVAAGSWWPGTPEKIQRAMMTALQLGIPVFYLIECAGLYLSMQDKTFASMSGAGAIFRTQAQLSKSGILQVAAIMGDCIAGGGYMPLMCDKIVMTEQATMCIGGTSLQSHSKGKIEHSIGSPAIHVHQSGCAECRVPDDLAAIAQLRSWARQMPTSANAFYRMDEPIEPTLSCEDLYHLIPHDPAKPFDILQVMARLADGGQIQLLMPEFGPEITAAFTLIDGLPCILIANTADVTQDSYGEIRAGGVIYRDGIDKMRILCEHANADGIPVIWLLDVAGFDIGETAEKDGLLRRGAMLLREHTCDETTSPAHLTIILRKASGAGYYVMKGAPFKPALTLATAISRLEVMTPETLAGTLYDRKIAKCNSPEKEEKKHLLEIAKQQTIEYQQKSSLPEHAAARGDIDAIIELRDMRKHAISFIRAAWQNSARPTKPPRLWSLWDDPPNN